MVKNWIEDIANHPSFLALQQRLKPGDRIGTAGAWGSSAHIVAGAIQHACRCPILLVVAHLDDADEAVEDLSLFGDITIAPFPALEVLPGESHASLELLTDRLELTAKLMASNAPDVIVASVTALMQPVPMPEAMSKLSLRLKINMEFDQSRLIHWLSEAGYSRSDGLEDPGDFTVRGGIVDIYPPGINPPIRLDFFGNQIDEIAEIDLETLRSDRKIEAISLIGASVESFQDNDQTTSFWSLLDPSTIVVMHETLEIDEQARGYYERLIDPIGIFAPCTLQKELGSFAVLEVNQYASPAMTDDIITIPAGPIPDFSREVPTAINELAELADTGDVVVMCQRQAEAERLQELIHEYEPQAIGKVSIETGYIYRGFKWEPHNPKQPELFLVTHHELFHRYSTRRAIRRVATTRTVDGFLEITPGDYVVHAHHGVAMFRGLKMMAKGRDSSDRGEEYLTLEFTGRTLLHVPASQIGLVHKYIGGFAGRPPLSKLGGSRWSKQKEKAAEAAKEMAAELLRVQAARAAMPGIRYPVDTAWVKQFEAEFPYQETDDQLAAMVEIKKNMSDPQPMDRLVCGDVGYGKTELAMRAVFKAIEHGKQAAILCPTTVLCEQHFRTFRDRMADYPFRVAAINRLKSTAEVKSIIEGLRGGSIDVVIGTHRLLSKDIQFADLGLVVVDEEQKFGVEHKSKLMRFRVTVDVMTLSATPIPRTLHMALLGLRDISSLSTPPADRRAVVTEVLPYDNEQIRRSIIRELNRGGQCYFVHNRVHNIRAVAAELQALVPEARIIVGHGQMTGRDLEEVMMKFVTQQADVLVCTTIIESGIDIPTANTMFIADCDRFGLAELHQLRGRVGRYKHRAYCYLLLPKTRTLSPVALRRLRAIEEYNMLGAGFKIAMRDMEIRGVGNLLGAEQSGHIAVVGYEMYCELLEEATAELKDRNYIAPVDTHLELQIHGHLPKRYIPSDKQRMDAYRRITRSGNLEVFHRVEQGVIDAYGPLPETAKLLFALQEIRVSASMLQIESVKLERPDLIFATREPLNLSPLLSSSPGSVRLIDAPGPRSPGTIYYRPPVKYLEDHKTLLAVLKKVLTPQYSQHTSR